jgi:hypothetical protein
MSLDSQIRVGDHMYFQWHKDAGNWSCVVKEVGDWYAKVEIDCVVTPPFALTPRDPISHNLLSTMTYYASYDRLTPRNVEEDDNLNRKAFMEKLEKMAKDISEQRIINDFLKIRPHFAPGSHVSWNVLERIDTVHGRGLRSRRIQGVVLSINLYKWTILTRESDGKEAEVPMHDFN